MSYSYDNVIKAKRKAKPIPLSTDSSRPVSSFSEELYSRTTTLTDTVVTDTTNDTLDMISSPWSSENHTTDQWTDSAAESFLTFVNRSSTFTSATIEPKTSTTISLETPLTSNTVTLTSHGNGVSKSNRASSVISPAPQPSHDTSCWTMESYTSTGMSSPSSRVRVKYPWSPKTFSFTDLETYSYPETSNSLSSRKVSRESFSGGGAKDTEKMMPMNYIAMSLDENVVFDWILVKQRGLDAAKCLIPSKV